MNTLAYFKQENTQKVLVEGMTEFFPGAVIPVYNTERKKWTVMVEDSDFIQAQAIFVALTYALSKDNASYRRQRMRDFGPPKEIKKRYEEDLDKETERQQIILSEIFEKSFILGCFSQQISAN